MRVRAIVASVMLLMMGDLCHGQSLADAARQNRLQKQKNGSSTKKVLTTDDLSPGADPKPAADAKAEPAKKDESKPEPYKTVGTAGFTPDMTCLMVPSLPAASIAWNTSSSDQRSWA